MVKCDRSNVFYMSGTAREHKMRRSIKIEGTDIELELSRATAVRTDKNMIHLDELPDGTWRLIFNSNMIPDFSVIEGFTIVREDD